MTFIGGLTGMAVGSFLGVMIDRSGWEVSQTSHSGKFAKLRGRSSCGSCRRQLRWWENIPLLSFVLLGGRCRTCRSPIPYWLFLIEIAGAAAGGAIAMSLMGQMSLMGLMAQIGIAAALVWIFFSDLVKGLVPDWAVGIGAIGALIFNFQFSIFNYVVAAAAASLFLGILVLATRGRGMGTGDVTLAFFLGLWLGWPEILVGIWLGFLIGAVWAIGLILLGRKKFGQTIPFGPFLICGSLFAAKWGNYLLDKLF